MRTSNAFPRGCRKNPGNESTPSGTAPDGTVADRKFTAPLSTALSIPDTRVRKILRMVESGATFAMRDLAIESHLSPAYLQRLFKHQTGVPMGEWLNEQKLQHAAHLLSNSYMSVKEIAYTVGYEHASSFIRAFERRFMQAPARFRRQADYAKC